MRDSAVGTSEYIPDKAGVHKEKGLRQQAPARALGQTEQHGLHTRPEPLRRSSAPSEHKQNQKVSRAGCEARSNMREEPSGSGRAAVRQR